MASHEAERFDRWMLAALEQARLAEEAGDVPVGAVVVRDEDGQVVASAHNRRTVDGDPTGHAELLAIRSAAEAIGDWRLSGCTMVATLEPCCMCAGAIVLARIGRLVYGADDPKAGAVRSLYRLCEDSRLNHRVEVVSGIRQTECSDILTAFFRGRRALGGK